MPAEKTAGTLVAIQMSNRCFSQSNIPEASAYVFLMKIDLLRVTLVPESVDSIKSIHKAWNMNESNKL